MIIKDVMTADGHKDLEFDAGVIYLNHKAYNIQLSDDVLQNLENRFKILSEAEAWKGADNEKSASVKATLDPNSVVNIDADLLKASGVDEEVVNSIAGIRNGGKKTLCIGYENVNGKPKLCVRDLNPFANAKDIVGKDLFIKGDTPGSRRPIKTALNADVHGTILGPKDIKDLLGGVTRSITVKTMNSITGKSEDRIVRLGQTKDGAPQFTSIVKGAGGKQRQKGDHTVEITLEGESEGRKLAAMLGGAKKNITDKTVVFANDVVKEAFDGKALGEKVSIDGKDYMLIKDESKNGNEFIRIEPYMEAVKTKVNGVEAYVGTRHPISAVNYVPAQFDAKDIKAMAEKGGQVTKTGSDGKDRTYEISPYLSLKDYNGGAREARWMLHEVVADAPARMNAAGRSGVTEKPYEMSDTLKKLLPQLKGGEAKASEGIGRATKSLGKQSGKANVKEADEESKDNVFDK